MAGLCPVGEAGFEALVGQRMLDQRVKRYRQNRGDVGTDQRGFLDMVNRADRSGQDLGLKIVIVVDLADFGLSSTDARTRKF